jgi:hypothetical protein
MAEINFTIPDDKIQLILDAFAVTQGYENGGETKAQFTKRMIKGYIKDIVARYERRLMENDFTGTTIDIT